MKLYQNWSIDKSGRGMEKILSINKGLKGFLKANSCDLERGPIMLKRDLI